MSPAPRFLLVAAFGFALLGVRPAAADLQPKTYRGSRLLASEADAWCSEARGAGGGGHALAGAQIVLKAASKSKNNKFVFSTARDQAPLVVNPDPRDDFHVLVRGGSDPDDRSALVSLDGKRWKKSRHGWKYKDPKGKAGGVRIAKIEKGQVKLKAKGKRWAFTPDGEDEPVSVHLRIGNQWYCSSFGETGTVEVNDTGEYKARDSSAPESCPIEMCGNGIHEVGEECDDGNLAPNDGCDNECFYSTCEGAEYASTFEALQSVVFDRYGCTGGLCHGLYDPLTGEPRDLDAANAHDSGLHLLPISAANLPTGAPQGLDAVLDYNHQALLTFTPANNTFFDHFAVEGDSKTSLVYQALYKKTHCIGAQSPPDTCGDLEATVQAMPDGTNVSVDPLELEALDIWLRAGAPRDGVVAGTADKLAACLPPATPQKIDPLAAPPAGEGVQLVSSAWDLPQQSENEVCFPIYYDFTDLVPPEHQVDCPTAGGEPYFGPNNEPEQKCFRWDRQLLLQDPQSHHSIIHIYAGEAPVGDPNWGAWTKKPNDPADPGAGESCDPLDIDPALGVNPSCSGEPKRTPACVFYGPPDFGQFGGIGGGGKAPQFSGSQETHYEQALYDGVYSILPLKGIVVFNSHAFNLTDQDTTMNQYLNLWFADESDDLIAQQIFEAKEIFWTPGVVPQIPPLPEHFPTVPPFKTREFCGTYTLPDGAHLFWLSSHNHRRGVRWRTWGPPNTPCSIDQCKPPKNDKRLMYYSTVYNDPTQLAIDPPLEFTGSVEDRTFLFCALYDNGSTPSSPPVKRASTSPVPPDIFGYSVGGPCPDDERVCISPKKKKQGKRCGHKPEPDRFCDSKEGAFDGLCDACPLRGGFSTEDEMFILLGNYFVP